MEIFKDQRILVVAPHPDDEIFGCGGLISRAKRAGAKVYVLFLTVGTTRDFSENALSRQDDRIAEIEKAAAFLGYDGYRVAFPGDEYHLRLDTLPQRTLIDEIECGCGISLQAVKPTIVVAPSGNDYNQDHRAVNRAVITATRPLCAKHKTLQEIVLKYEAANTWSDCGFKSAANFYVELTEEDLQAKLRAVEIYKSQLKGPFSPFSVHGVVTAACARGIECGKKYAEGFEARRFLA